jgi:hypothetical protein
MPPIRHTRGSKKPPPDGFDEIEDTLLDFANKMKDAESAPHEGKKKNEATWDIFRISHQRLFPPPSPPFFPGAAKRAEIGSRYIYELYYKKEAISKPLYDWLLKNGYGDPNLIAKWYVICGGKGRVVRGMLTIGIGRNKATRNYAACAVSRPRNTISTRRVFAACRGRG